jgi:alkylhydroperoxidase family enzyme
VTVARIAIPDGEGTERERIYALRPQLGAAAKALRDQVYATTLPHRLAELVRYRIALINDCSF